MISSDHLKPGDLGRIRAVVNTAGRRGPLAKHVTVYSNDRSIPVLSLSLVMDIVLH